MREAPSALRATQLAANASFSLQGSTSGPAGVGGRACMHMSWLGLARKEGTMHATWQNGASLAQLVLPSRQIQVPKLGLAALTLLPNPPQHTASG